MGDRRRSSSRKHFKGRMAAKGVFSLVFVFACVATSQVYGKATDPPTTDPPTTDPPTTPHCECINPFLEPKPEKAYRGDPDTLCGPKGPGVCYVDCNADCRDIEPTASASRCKSSLACDVFNGTEWE